MGIESSCTTTYSLKCSCKRTENSSIVQPYLDALICLCVPLCFMQHCSVTARATHNTSGQGDRLNPMRLSISSLTLSLLCSQHHFQRSPSGWSSIVDAQAAETPACCASSSGFNVCDLDDSALYISGQYRSFSSSVSPWNQ